MKKDFWSRYIDVYLFFNNTWVGMLVVTNPNDAF